MKRSSLNMMFFIGVMVWAMGVFTGPKLYAQGGHGDTDGTHGTFSIPAGIGGCEVCHDATFPGLPDGSQSGLEIMWLREVIDLSSLSPPDPPGNSVGPITFTIFIPDDPLNPTGALVDGNGNGICEVCHTDTGYYRYDGTSPNGDHYPYEMDGEWIGWNCTECHGHFRIGNRVSRTWFEPNLKGGQSHDTHRTDLKGPRLSKNFGSWGVTYECDVCHYPSDRHYFRDSTFPDDMRDLAATTVCDECHSTGGAYGGVDFAKAAWEPGVYDPETDLEEVKEEYRVVWCAHCHDDVPTGKVASTIYDVAAPNVMGDNLNYGYNVCGHGVADKDPTLDVDLVICSDCHDLKKKHTDKKARTYRAADDNYKKGYRHRYPMDIPRPGGMGSPWHESVFQLCFFCHDYDAIMSERPPFETNFRTDLSPNRNFHWHHLGRPYASAVYWDSDWDGFVDSGGSCPACHNVHGSPMKISGSLVPNPVMIRHGELISSPGTQDKVPALDFKWLDNYENPVSDFIDSFAGRLIGGAISDIAPSNVCYGCHADPYGGKIVYERSPGQVLVNDVRTHKLFYNPGETIKYIVDFTIIGKRDYYVKAAGIAWSKTGTYWEDSFVSKVTLEPGPHTIKWVRTVPGSATPGSVAKVKITVKIRKDASAPLIDLDSGTALFNINP